jgi:hypothetical protein
MYYLILDTCVWIDLCSKYPDVLIKILELVKQNKIQFIVPETIIEEWNRDKHRAIVDVAKPIDDLLRIAKDFAKSLSDPKLVGQTKRIISSLRALNEEVKKAVTQRLGHVEQLFDDVSTTRLPISESAKLQAVNLALNKKAPFQSKNSMADALIILSATEHITKEGLTNCIFVSRDVNDFSQKPGQTQIHDDLKELFSQCHLMYFIHIGQAINEVEEGLITAERVAAIEASVRFDIFAAAFIRQQEELQAAFRQALKSVDISPLADFQQALKSVAILPSIRQQEELLAAFQQALKSAGISPLADLQQALKSVAILPSIRQLGELLAAAQQRIKAPDIAAESEIREKKANRHRGDVQVVNSFQAVHTWLSQNGPSALTTAKGTHFEARPDRARKGTHKGELVIRFFQEGKEYGRSYECCWGHRQNCYGTYIGIYCTALDAEVSR